MKNILHRIKKHKSRSVTQNFSFLEWMFWAAFAAYYPMIVVYLRNRGYTSTIIGIIVAVNSLVVIVAQPLWGMVSDYISSIKKVFIFCLAMTICLLMTLPLYKGVWITGIAFAVITFFETGMVPLMDNWIIQGIKRRREVHYGSIRLWGSLGFTVFVYIINVVIDHTTINSMFIFFAVLGTGTIMWSLGIEDQEHAVHSDRGGFKLGKLLKQKEYVLFLLFAFFIFIPFRAAAIFLPNAMDALGGGQSQLGLAFSVMALSEVPIFFFSGRLVRRYKPKIIILVSSLFFILRQLFYYLSLNPFHIICVQGMQGITYGLFLAGAIYYIDALAPEDMKSTAQTVATAVYVGMGGVIGSFGGGWIIDNYGISKMYLLGTIISIIISIFFLIAVIFGKNQNITAESDHETI